MSQAENEKIYEDDAPMGLLAKLKRELGVAVIAGLGIGLIYGGLVGMGVVFTQDEFSFAAFAVCIVCLTIGIPICLYAYRKTPSLREGDPDTPRARRMGKMVFFLMCFAVVIMLPFVIRGDTLEGMDLFSNGPVPAWIALFLGIIWALGMPLLVYINRQNMDELERTEFQFGETLGFQFFGIAAPVWWIAARGGLVPPPDVMILFIATLVVSVLANLYRKIS